MPGVDVEVVDFWTLRICGFTFTSTRHTPSRSRRLNWPMPLVVRPG
jgi:hypothetical protein